MKLKNFGTLDLRKEKSLDFVGKKKKCVVLPRVFFSQMGIYDFL